MDWCAHGRQPKMSIVYGSAVKSAELNSSSAKSENGIDEMTVEDGKPEGQPAIADPEGKGKPQQDTRAVGANLEREATENSDEELGTSHCERELSSSDEDEPDGKSRGPGKPLKNEHDWEVALDAQDRMIEKWLARVQRPTMSFSGWIKRPENNIELELARIFDSPGGPRVQRDVAMQFLSGVRSVYERVMNEVIQNPSKRMCWLLDKDNCIKNVLHLKRSRRKKPVRWKQRSGNRTA